LHACLYLGRGLIFDYENKIIFNTDFKLFYLNKFCAADIRQQRQKHGADRQQSLFRCFGQKTIGRIDNNRVFDGSGKTLGRIDNNRLYDASGKSIGRVDGNRLYDASGRSIGRIDGNRFYDSQGRTLGRTEGVSDRELVLFWFFYMK
jgi:hypothetical protein